MKMTFSSGNMSSGVVTHHENWHFIDVKRDSYFGQAHVCLMDAQVSATASSGAAVQGRARRVPRRDRAPRRRATSRRSSSRTPRTASARRRYLLGGVTEAARSISARTGSATRAWSRRSRRKLEDGDLTLRMVADDDLYWLDPVAGASQRGRFEPRLRGRQRREARDRRRRQLRDPVLRDEQQRVHAPPQQVPRCTRTPRASAFGLIAGAANLTGAGFNDNFENIYFIKVPKVLEAFETQFARVWDGKKATPERAGSADRDAAPPDARGVRPGPVITRRRS